MQTLLVPSLLRVTPEWPVGHVHQPFLLPFEWYSWVNATKGTEKMETKLTEGRIFLQKKFGLQCSQILLTVSWAVACCFYLCLFHYKLLLLRIYACFVKMKHLSFFFIAGLCSYSRSEVRDRHEGVLWPIRWTGMSQIESPLGFLLALSQALLYMKLLCMYSNLNIFSKIYRSEGVLFKVFASCSFLKFKVAVSELWSIFCVMWEDFNRSMRRLFNGKPESPAEVPWFAFRGYRAYSKKKDYGTERS